MVSVCVSGGGFDERLVPENLECWLVPPSAAPRLMGVHSAHLIHLLVDQGTTEQMASFVCTVLSAEGRWVVVWLLAVI